MQADLREITETINGTFVNPEPFHEFVDMVFMGSDPNELTDDYTNVMLVTNLVHIRLMEVAQEVDIVAIVFTNGHKPKPKEIERAKELEIDLIQTAMTLEDIHKNLKATFGASLDIRTKLQPH
jgi:hypothetical protein